MRPRTVKVWLFAIEWMIEHGESDCFDHAALRSLKSEFGVVLTKRTWAKHLSKMERVGLIRGHRMIVSLEFAKLGTDFLRGPWPGAYIAYTLPGMVPLGRNEGWVFSERVERTSGKRRR